MKTQFKLLLLFFFAAQISFAQTIKISALPIATGTGAGSYAPIVQAGITKKILVDSLRTDTLKLSFRIEQIKVKNTADSTVLANLIKNRYDSLRRLPGSLQVEGRKNNIWYPVYIDSAGGSAPGGGSGITKVISGLGLKNTNDSTIRLDTSYGKKYFLYGLSVPNDSTVRVDTLQISTVRALRDSAAAIRSASGGGGGGGGGTPGGNSSQIQYNSGGSFAGSSTFTYNPSPTPSGGMASNLRIAPTATISATANNDTIVALDVKAPVYATAGFSGIKKYALRVKASTTNDLYQSFATFQDSDGSPIFEVQRGGYVNVIGVLQSNTISPSTGGLVTFDGKSYFTSTSSSASLGTMLYGGNPATIDGSALVELRSITKALLLTRMTKSERDAMPTKTAGNIIYQTDNTPGLRVYNGSNWMKFTETSD
ncbi:MAG: hypothetical protein H7320_11670 [Ferruginibacter sp.]|nr:hypothetical protein [Ferruginibacter sp.]